MAARDSNFFLAAPENPDATYKVLWYDIPSSVPRSTHSPPIIRPCRVNLFVPGVMNIPDVPRGCVMEIPSGKWMGLPLMPLIPLLMLKLQDWMVHSKPGVAFTRRSVRTQRSVDFLTIGELLDVGVRRGYTVDAYRAWLPVSLFETAEEQIPRYNIYNPIKADRWQRLGFTVASTQGWPTNWVWSASQTSEMHEFFAKMNLC